MSRETDKTGRALHAWICLARAAGRVGTDIHQHLLDDGLTPSQFGALEALLHLGPLSQRTLSAKVLSSENNMTTVIDNLQRQGYVVREVSPEDRRVKVVRLTARGRRKIETVFDRHAAVVTDRMSALSAGQQDQLAALCRRLGLGTNGPRPGRG